MAAEVSKVQFMKEPRGTDSGAGAAAESVPGDNPEIAHADSVIIRSSKWWNAAFYVLAAALVAAFATLIEWPQSLGALIPLLVTVAAYSALILPRWPTPVHGQVYIAIMLACLWTATALAPYSAFWYFFVFAHVWMFAKNAKWAFANVAVMAAGLIVALYIRLPQVTLDQLTIQIILPSLVCMGAGYWIHLIIAQSEERAELLAALRRTQEALASANRDAGATAERERLARDIHDTLAQGFTSVVVLADAALAQAAKGQDVSATLSSLRQIGQDNLNEARALVSGGSSHWDDENFTAALQRTCDAQDWLHVEATIGAYSGGLDQNQKVMLLRALQESLTNARKHSGAGRVRVTLSEEGPQVILVIDDDGTGFNSRSAPGYTEGLAKFGLFSMRQRAEEVGARLTIDSRIGKGTRVRVEVER